MSEKRQGGHHRAAVVYQKRRRGSAAKKLLEADNHPEYRDTAIDLLMLIGSVCGVEAERLEKR